MEEIVFKLTVQDVHIIGQALGAMPYGTVKPLIDKLDAQLAEQRAKPKLVAENNNG
jgi:hypothetical protein